MKKIDLYSDHDLIRRLRADDQLAFELLFYRYKDKIRGFAAQLAPPQIDPDEIVQKVFIKIWIQRNKIDPGKNFSSFLFTIAKNEVIDQIRSSVNRKIYFLGDELIADLNITGQEKNLQEGLQQKMEELIKQIPERRRQIFELSRFEGLTYKKIACRLHISENTVDTQVRKALDFLRKEMKRVRFLILTTILFYKS